MLYEVNNTSFVSMDQLSIPYFRDLLSTNIDNLRSLCQEWEKISSESVPEEVCDEMRSTIGLTNLLVDQKLKQFSGLIDDSEFKRGEKEISCLDLQGFWDMVYNEVEKIKKRFLDLEKCKENNWKFVEESAPRVETKKRFIPAIAKSAVATKRHASAARQRLAEAKLKIKAQMALQKENVIKTDALDTNNGLSLKVENETMKYEMIITQNNNEPDELKSTISNITNFHISKLKQQSKISNGASEKYTSKNIKSFTLAIETGEKENVQSSYILDDCQTISPHKLLSKAAFPYKLSTSTENLRI